MKMNYCYEIAIHYNASYSFNDYETRILPGKHYFYSNLNLESDEINCTLDDSINRNEVEVGEKRFFWEFSD